MQPCPSCGASNHVRRLKCSACDAQIKKGKAAPARKASAAPSGTGRKRGRPRKDASSEPRKDRPRPVGRPRGRKPKAKSEEDGADGSDSEEEKPLGPRVIMTDGKELQLVGIHGFGTAKVKNSRKQPASTGADAVRAR